MLIRRHVNAILDSSEKPPFIMLLLMALGRNEATDAVIRRCSVKKMFLEISQNSQENTCARVSFLIKLQALEHLFLQTTSGGCF